MLKIRKTRSRLRRINPTPLIESRVESQLSSAKHYFIGKWFFHLISIVSTGVMFGVYVPRLLNGPLGEYGLSIKDYAETMAVPTLVFAMIAAMVLEINTTSVTKSAFSELGGGLKSRSGGLLAFVWAVFLPIFSVGALGALQIYSFGQGAKYSFIKYQLPDAKFEALKTVEADKDDIVEQIEELKATRKKVRDGLEKPDTRYGKPSSDPEQIRALKRKIIDTMKAYEAWEARENKKPVNFKNGKLRPHVKLMYAVKKSKMIDPLKNKLLWMQSKESDPVKHWLNSADRQLQTLKKRRDNLEKQKEALETELIALKNKVSEMFPDSVYYAVGAFLLLVLATMDYYYNEYLRRANSTIYNNRPKAKESLVENDSYRLEEPEPAKAVRVDADDEDRAFLEYLSRYYQKHGRMPSQPKIATDLSKSLRDVARLYERNSSYFVRKPGTPTVPTEQFLREYGLVMAA